MPYTPAQRRLFNAATDDPAIAREHGLTHREAGKLADEANKLKGDGRERKATGKASELDHAAQPLSVIDLSPVWLPRTGP